MALIDGSAQRIDSGGLSLEGLLHLPAGEGPFPGIVICHPHPQFGGEMYNNVVGALVKAALGAGVAALRFNFRGVGESEGAYGGGKGEQQDVIAALDHLRSMPEIDDAKVAVAGYSFGASVALQAASGRNDLRTVVAVSSPTQRDAAAHTHLPCPTLFVTGDRDEYCDPELLPGYGEQTGRGVTVEVLPGVDHFWWGSDRRLIEIVQGWLERHLPAVS